MMRVFVSFFVAGFFAGVISWLANCILGFLVGDRDGAGQEEDDD
jgi:uncharacterized membrane protein